MLLWGHGIESFWGWWGRLFPLGQRRTLWKDWVIMDYPRGLPGEKRWNSPPPWAWLTRIRGSPAAVFGRFYLGKNLWTIHKNASEERELALKFYTLKGLWCHSTAHLSNRPFFNPGISRTQQVRPFSLYCLLFPGEGWARADGGETFR